jgi:nicotinate-nucleotide adenylyltransferase
MVNRVGAWPALSRLDARIGLLGGTFDPIHLGHLAIARAALAELALDYLFFIPASQAPLRGAAPVASAADRLALINLAIKETADPRLGVLDLEMHAGGIQYTIDTVRAVQAAWPKAHLYWLLGADQFAQLDQWREPKELARRVEFAVLDRPGLPAPAPPSALAAIVRWKKLTGTTNSASSTEIRRRYHAGESMDLWLPRAVAAAIDEKKLYR